MTPGLGVGWAEHVLERHWGRDTLAREPREQTTPPGPHTRGQSRRLQTQPSLFPSSSPALGRKETNQ